MSDYSTIIFSVEGPMARITLNDPATSNALSRALLGEFKQAMRHVEELDEVRVCIIDAKGKNFCAGANIAGQHDIPDTYRVSDDLYTLYFPILDAIAKLPKIFIVEAQGAIAGIAGALAMTADFLVMAEDGYIYQPFMAINLVPDGGTHWHLVRTIGYKRAMDLILTGKRLPAAQCVEFGLATKSVPHKALSAEVYSLAAQLIAGPPMAQVATKKICRAATTASLLEVFDMECDAQNPLMQSRDFQAGVAAFFENKKPQFDGQ